MVKTFGLEVGDLVHFLFPTNTFQKHVDLLSGEDSVPTIS